MIFLNQYLAIVFFRLEKSVKMKFLKFPNLFFLFMQVKKASLIKFLIYT